MVTVPADIPITFPALPTEATVVSEEDQTPPVTTFDKVKTEPAVTAEAPVIVPGSESGLTETVTVAVPEQPDEVPVTVYVVVTVLVAVTLVPVVEDKPVPGDQV
jgi:hypothetical protein